ncbi:transposase [Rossellomorea sp. SC111]|uniref:transposase n=1 Tax=Rossellomorea sp. SC111 TaxID=2968985 RepID=UPI0035C75090
MTRNLRVWYPGAIYHITARGNRKNNLFRDRKDYLHYLSLTQKAKERTPFLLHSYCLMPNHVHLIIGTLMILPQTLSITLTPFMPGTLTENIIM